MLTIQRVRCPNCGSYAERQYYLNHQITQTQCLACDYFMVNCSRTGKVMEAYAPGVFAPSSEVLEARSCPQAASASNPRE